VAAGRGPPPPAAGKPDDLQVEAAVAHQVGRQVHQRQHGAGPRHDADRGHQSHQQVEADGGVDDDAGFFLVSRPQILGDHHAGADADEAEQGDGEIEDLVAHRRAATPDRRHGPP
jgi:hypothetical protein